MNHCIQGNYFRVLRASHGIWSWPVSSQFGSDARVVGTGEVHAIATYLSSVGISSPYVLSAKFAYFMTAPQTGLWFYKVFFGGDNRMHI